MILQNVRSVVLLSVRCGRCGLTLALLRKAEYDVVDSSCMDTAAKADDYSEAPARRAGEGELVSLRKKNGLPLAVLMAMGILTAFLPQAPAVAVPFYVVLAAGATYFGLSWAFGALRLTSHSRRSHP